MIDAEGLKPTKEELALYDDISELAKVLWNKTTGMRGFNTDPKMFSNALFKRLWSNHKGFTLLWNNHFRVESDIVLRSGIEAAICISAVYEMREDFLLLMRQDAAATLQGQIKMYRDEGVDKMVRDTESALRLLQKGFPEGTKAARLDWKTLAEKGGIPQLYFQHRHLSGVSSHVTGLSVMDAMGGEGMDERQEELRKHSRKMHLMSMACATLHGSLKHGGMIDAHDEVAQAAALIDRMNELSWDWPGVPERSEPDVILEQDIQEQAAGDNINVAAPDS